MAGKFVPNGDLDFLTKAESFARTTAKDPARFELAPGDADELAAAATRFRAAYQASRFGERSQSATRASNDARAGAARVCRWLGHLVRSDPRLDAPTKILLGVHEREARPRVRPCPPEPPRPRFVRAPHEGNGATPAHVLDSRAFDLSPAKPGGAVLEVQFRSFHPQHVPPATAPAAAALLAPPPPEHAEARRLEGPPPPAAASEPA